MIKFHQFLIIIITSCLLLSACWEKVPVTTPEMKLKSVSPTVGSTEEKELVVTPDMSEKLVSPTVVNKEEKAVVITQDMNGKLVSLNVGDTFEVQIPTIPMAGFEWKAKDLDKTILLQLGDPVFKADSSPNGAGGIVTLKYRAIGAGKTTLILLYLHPSENGAPSLYNNSFGVTIEVK